MTGRGEEEISYGFRAPLDAPWSAARTAAEPLDLSSMLRQRLAAQYRQVRAHTCTCSSQHCLCEYAPHLPVACPAL